MSSPEEHDPGSVDRREFFKRLAFGSTAAAGALGIGYGLREEGLPLEEERTPSGGGQAAAGDPLPAERAGPSVLAVARGEDPAAITTNAIQALGGMEKFVSPGDRVLLKPNVGWDRRPKFAANTNPDVVAALARLCLEAGAGKVVVTDSPCNNPARCFDKSGMKKALKDIEVELLNPTERDYEEIDLGGHVLKTWPVLKVLGRSDKVINVPIAKHHSSAILSMGMKNWYGILGGGKQRGQLHQEMARGIAELANFVRPTLTVLDAYRILVRNGPQGGNLNDAEKRGVVAASRDPVAVDAWGATLFELAPEEVPYIPLAVEMGLGNPDLGAIEIIEV